MSGWMECGAGSRFSHASKQPARSPRIAQDKKFITRCASVPRNKTNEYMKRTRALFGLLFALGCGRLLTE